MMLAKYSVLFGLVAVLFAVGASHALQINPTSITITSNSISYFNITFYNNGISAENITLDTVTPTVTYGYYFNSISAYPHSFLLPPVTSKTILFSFVTNDVYSSTPIQITIPYTENGSSQNFVLNAPITPPSSAAVSVINVSLPSSLYPYQRVNFTVKLLNGIGSIGVKIPFNYTLLSNGGAVYTYTGTLILDSLGLNIFNFSFPINRSITPGMYSLGFSVKYTGAFYSFSSHTDILAFSSEKVSYANNIGVFGGNRSITVTNDGNTPIQSSQLEFPVGGFNSLFVAAVTSGRLANDSMMPSASVLQPGQTVVLTYTVSYLPLYIVVIVVAAAILGFLVFNRKVRFTKEVVEHKSVEGFIDVKLALRLKNISRGVLKGIELSDVLPPNSLKVSIVGQKEGKTVKRSDGIHVDWKEDELAPGDEIIVMYEIKSKVGILGGFSLGPADVKFRYAGKGYSKRSNSLILNIK